MLIIIIVFIGFFASGNQMQCISQTQSVQRYMNGQYKNILQLYKGGILTTARTNTFQLGKIGFLLNDKIYLSGQGLQNTYCSKPCFMKLQLLQTYYINTIQIRMFDQTGRNYDLKIYVAYEGIENLIYQNTALVGPLTVKFQKQQVEYIKFVNVNGNNQSGDMSIVKVIAFYRF